MKRPHDAALSVLTPEFQSYAQIKAKLQKKAGVIGAYLVLTDLVDNGYAEQRVETFYTGSSPAKGFTSSFRLRRL